MQNKVYIEAYADARLFADFMGSTVDKVEQLVVTFMFRIRMPLSHTTIIWT